MPRHGAEAIIFWSPDAKSPLIEKTLILGKIEHERRTGQQRMIWHHWFNRHELEQTLGYSGGQGPGMLQSMQLQSLTRLSGWTPTRNVHTNSASTLTNNYIWIWRKKQCIWEDYKTHYLNFLYCKACQNLLKKGMDRWSLSLVHLLIWPESSLGWP